MKTVAEVLKLSTAYLQKYQVQFPRKIAENILSDVLHIKRLDLYLNFDRPLEKEELDRCREILKKCAQKVPYAYILGYIDFFDCRIDLTQDVLIPRQETEILTDKVYQYLYQQDLEGKILLDLCCGSGCIGISLKKKLPQLKVVAVDISKKAIDLAKKNAQKNKVKVEFFHCDLFKAFKEEKFDYIVANPPYISEKEYFNLDYEVKNFEPKLALLAGTTGFEIYEKIAEKAPFYLKKGGKLWMEIGFLQGSGIKKLFSKEPWKNCLIEKDWAGHDRFASVDI